MRNQWTPKEVLRLRGDGRCVSHAPSKGRKCTLPISYHNDDEFQALLRDMARERPDADLLEPKLRRLAQYGLCVRFHQSKADDMVRKWSAEIRAAYPPQRTARNEDQLANALESVSSSHTPSAIASQRQSTVESVRSTERLSQSVSRVSTADIPSVHLSRSTTTQSTATSGTPQSNSQVSRPRASGIPTIGDGRSPLPAAGTTTPQSSPPRPILSSVSIPGPPSSDSSNAGRSASLSSSPVRLSTSTSPITEQSTPARSCADSHVRRRLLDEECAICYDDVLLSECNLSDLVWCRSGCGRSVHKSCFEGWRNAGTYSGPLNCTICRTTWAEDCDCDGDCIVPHVRRREIEGQCSVCQQDLEDDSDGQGATAALSWCKGSCGRSVHTECFNVWRTACLDDDRTPTCTDCRGEWVEECEC